MAIRINEESAASAERNAKTGLEVVIQDAQANAQLALFIGNNGEGQLITVQTSLCLQKKRPGDA